jgi:cytochrome c oxidase subunit II
LPSRPRTLYARRVVRLVVLASLIAALVAAGVALAAGNPAAGKKVYAANGCGGCHTFKPAGSKGTIGPALTKVRLAADAKRAKQPLTTFIRTSIVKPKAYVASGYKPIMPSFAKLSKKQLDDLVAFIAKG